MNNELENYISAVNYLLDNLEYMIEGVDCVTGTIQVKNLDNHIK
ncbi:MULTISPECIES: hypothetical protein [unclassified Clostridioides]